MLGLRDCRRQDQYEAFSLCRIADLVNQLSSDVSLPCPPEWVSDVLGAVGIAELSAHQVFCELKKLFDKRRPQIVGVW
jgi:hypothetical protein